MVFLLLLLSSSLLGDFCTTHQVSSGAVCGASEHVKLFLFPFTASFRVVVTPLTSLGVRPVIRRDVLIAWVPTRPLATKPLPTFFFRCCFLSSLSSVRASEKNGLCASVVSISFWEESRGSLRFRPFGFINSNRGTKATGDLRVFGFIRLKTGGANKLGKERFYTIFMDNYLETI